MTSKSRKSLLVLIAGALAVALLFIAFRPHPTAVDLEAVTRGPLQVTINADGKTRIKDLYEVSSPIAGTALRSPVEEGDQVEAGVTVVARVEPLAPSLIDARTRIQLEAAVREASAAADLAEAQLRQADEELNYAQSQFDRTKALVDRGVSSVSTLEDAEQVLSLRTAARDAAISNVQMAQSSLARAQAALLEPGAEDMTGDTCCVAITAPISGTVLVISQVSEHAVAIGSELLSIGDLNDLEIEADILSSDAVGLEIGARAIVERWGGEPPLEAKLKSLAPRAETHTSSLGIEEQRVAATFDLVTPAEERLGLGHQYAVFLRVVEWETDAALNIPLAALFRSNGDWAVFVAEGDRARLRLVEIGHRTDRRVEILSGLEEGEQVIPHPADTIADGVVIVDRESL
ncbi:efflux RND transporter periplasmic adaptor subunit [Celeribacter litoreus]|uniref:efflux RND transporter periplasmic adaptor subunit n=1 Tax=Celeribacter litoreus TaxID=2876714 RepID=UPI001CCF380C|nr:HlyD family efflux transporter periplasmic adaptor subunit [Celeribacter litoreus]MCA0042607.1 HlyD family efflux transporter periplasmic adaptor subunit [Celeribacter litoreus]